MPLPASWVDHLFGRLALRYGAAFMRQWPDADAIAIKADWADVLDGTRGESIGYALRYLPMQPPNALQFREICRRAPEPQVALLTDDRPPSDPERVRAAVEAMRGTRRQLDKAMPAQQCIDNIERSVAARGGRISDAQRHVLEHCRRLSGAPSHLAQEEREAA